MSLWGLSQKHINEICHEIDACEQAGADTEAVARCLAAIRPHVRKVLGAGMRLSTIEKLLEARDYDRSRKVARSLAREPTFVALAVFMVIVLGLGFGFVRLVN